MHDELPSGKILCLAEGEGRNAVWLAEQRNEVTAVDASKVGLQKAEKLAKKHGVNITTVHADLADYDTGIQQWDGIISIVVLSSMPTIRNSESEFLFSFRFPSSQCETTTYSFPRV